MQVETINKIHGFWPSDDVLFINNNTCLQETTSWRKAKRTGEAIGETTLW